MDDTKTHTVTIGRTDPIPENSTLFLKSFYFSFRDQRMSKWN